MFRWKQVIQASLLGHGNCKVVVVVFVCCAILWFAEANQIRRLKIQGNKILGIIIMGLSPIIIVSCNWIKLEYTN